MFTALKSRVMLVIAVVVVVILVGLGWLYKQERDARLEVVAENTSLLRDNQTLTMRVTALETTRAIDNAVSDKLEKDTQATVETHTAIIKKVAKDVKAIEARSTEANEAPNVVDERVARAVVDSMWDSFCTTNPTHTACTERLSAPAVSGDSTASSGGGDTDRD